MSARILERVRRLLALTQSSNVHEAAAAAAAAQRIMSEHRIDAAELEFESGAAPLELEAEDLEVLGGKDKPWRGYISIALAEANGCATWLSYRRVGRESKPLVVARILGSADNVATVRYMQTYLCREVERLTAERLASPRMHVFKSFRPRAWANSFRKGAAAALAERIAEAAKEARAASSKTDALALLDREAEELARRLAELKIGAATRAGPIAHSEAFRAGAAAAASIPLAPTQLALPPPTTGNLEGDTDP